jgi:hypothetical protein
VENLARLASEYGPNICALEIGPFSFPFVLFVTRDRVDEADDDEETAEMGRRVCSDENDKAEAERGTL